ncbi:MAG TPA: hypothetical protein VK753_09065 [Xanthomonadaceae bacterium]|nr:hypothetical protein [Xanthomonadaceae bacterium]
MKFFALGLAGTLSLALAGCTGSHGGLDADAQTTSTQVDRSVAIGDLVRDYQQARAAKQWDLALSYAAQLQRMAPDSALATEVQATVADTSEHAEEEHDRTKLATLWTYNVGMASGDDTDDVLSTASIAADAASDADDGIPPPRLVLRHDPKGGRSVDIVLDQGSFDCAAKCAVSVRFDDQPAHPFTATAPAQGGQALSIDDEPSIRESLDKVRVITIDASIDGKPRSLSFDVGGFDRVQFERKLQ